MHTLWTRANAIFAFTLSVLAAATFAAFLSTLAANTSAPVHIKVSNPRLKSVSDYSANGARSDLAMFGMDIEVDVSPIYNWNVKQLFLYLVAEYQTPKNVMNQVVLWDKIIMRDERSVVHEENLVPKYYFFDDGNNLLNHKNVTLQLRWNVIPNAGYIRLAQGEGTTKVEFPASYITGRF
ncbi:hypothetical protein QR680_013570 [Steinernema hermaphroditum]|uniref:Signal peptidase complex subunit 3 n=1 Tax=Steinernema hermaphroditum TaxID=289476 RepID=A0AA39I5Z4_9BILA|nr:hypothetical protein QR680_013570 [Steinernema hermaphroditum]